MTRRGTAGASKAELGLAFGRLPIKPQWIPAPSIDRKTRQPDTERRRHQDTSSRDFFGIIGVVRIHAMACWQPIRHHNNCSYKGGNGQQVANPEARIGFSLRLKNVTPGRRSIRRRGRRNLYARSIDLM
jgi:hypothetical protein